MICLLAAVEPHSSLRRICRCCPNVRSTMAPCSSAYYTCTCTNHRKQHPSRAEWVPLCNLMSLVLRALFGLIHFHDLDKLSTGCAHVSPWIQLMPRKALRFLNVILYTARSLHLVGLPSVAPPSSHIYTIPTMASKIIGLSYALA